VTFQTACYAVDGNEESGNFLRLMLNSATLGSQGVVGALDCAVQANTVPTAGINVTSGAVVVLGAEAAYQGSYYAYNTGTDSTLTIASTGGSPRSDMIVARAEDPTWSGSPWGNPASGQIIFPRVISGVASSATTPPSGQSCIPLARIDMPASTSVVQGSYIHDLRQVCNPQRIMQVMAITGPSVKVSSPGSAIIVPTQWPTGAIWSVQIPSFATTMVIAWSCNELEWNGDTNVRANLWPVIGSSVSAPVVTTPQSLVSYTSAAGPWRHTIGGGGTVAIPASIRGTTQTLQFVYEETSPSSGTMSFGEGCSVTVTVEFQQLASAA
jgi:hypothetical protein